MPSPLPKILVVCGPTASGKTELAFMLCRRFAGEVVGADSMQVYRGLAIGTAAEKPAAYSDVPLHLVGFLPPERAFSVAEYVAKAGEVIDDILARGRLPVVCGGTGLYLQSLIEGVRFTEDSASPEKRQKLEEDWQHQGAEAMLRRLAACDAAAAEKLHPADKKRILRALEVLEITGLTMVQQNEASRMLPPPYSALCVALGFPDRAQLYARIDRRVEDMLTAGLLDEARQVYQNRESYRTAAQAIGYKEFFPFFEESATLDECTQKLKQATRNYAKRQLTWLRRMPYVHWLAAEDADVYTQAERLAAAFLQA